jgi:hypothetical protein
MKAESNNTGVNTLVKNNSAKTLTNYSELI